MPELPTTSTRIFPTRSGSPGGSLYLGARSHGCYGPGAAQWRLQGSIFPVSCWYRWREHLRFAELALLQEIADTATCCQQAMWQRLSVRSLGQNCTTLCHLEKQI